MKNIFSIPRGTSDILPKDTAMWRRLEAQARELMRLYAYKEIRTPVFEETELFARSVGQTSDIVQKQMLNLAPQIQGEDVQSAKAGTLSLRPEGTAAVVRSYIENGLARKERLSKLFYIGPMFRGERPQKGRLRQFHQIGVEALGAESMSAYLDAEVISLSVELLKCFGVRDFVLKISTLGDAADKERFSAYLKDRLSEILDKFCPDCRSRYHRNVFRVLDCKNKTCRGIIRHLDLKFEHLSQESRDYYEALKAALTEQGVEYQQDPCLVRGLDYYTHTVFELSCSRLGSQDALGAGGRYNHLVKQLGGPQIDATGFALGIERILLAAEVRERTEADRLDIFVFFFCRAAFPRAARVLSDLRRAEITADARFSGGSLKSRMRQADKLNARYVILIGQTEVEQETLILKDMDSGTQQQVSLQDIIKAVKRK